MQSTQKNKIIYILFCIILIAECTAIFLVQRDGRDNENWAGPYFSAAANLHFGGGFQIDLNEVNYFKELSPAEQYAFHFTRSENTVSYNHNPVGFAYIIVAAKTLFFFTGDEMALVIFQVLIHFLLCLLVITLIKNRSFAITFLVVYALNPVIINFVVLNYYYFWQCIPGFVILLLLSGKANGKWQPWVFSLLVTFATLTRPTILFISIFCFLLYFYYYRNSVAIINLVLAAGLLFLLYKPTEKNIWHTIYVGIAAYPNNYIQSLSDNAAYDLYAQRTGTELNASVGGNYYADSVISRYQEITKEEVTRIFREQPGIFIRNAVLNTFQSFSPGYFNLNKVWLNIISAIAGCIFLVLLWIARQRFIILCVLIYAGSFCLYYPPIQAYLFGAYILTAVGLYGICCKFFPERFTPLAFTLPFGKSFFGS